MQLGLSLSIVQQAYSGGPSGPTNTVAPVISGTATVGQTLSSTTGTWTGEGTITYAYQWLDDGAAISGATSSTYTLTAGEEGGNITCRVTATDDNGSTAATSNSLGPVAAATGAPLSLDFANDTYSDGTNTAFGDIFTFSRSGSATYVDSSGVIQTAATGVARRNHYEYNGTSWVNKGLLLETDSATNLLPYSADFTQWTNNETSDASGVTAPDNSSNATALTENTANDYHSAYILTSAAAANWTASLYIKQKDAGRYIQLRPFGIGTNVAWADFDPSDGSLYRSGGTSLVSTTSEDAGNGWYRVSMTCSSALFSGDGVEISISDGGPGGERRVYLGDGSSGVYVWGAQLEEGDYPSSYIPTSGSTVTRASEALEVKAASVPWSTTAMSFVFKGEASWTDNDNTREVTLFGAYFDASNRFVGALSTAGGNTGRLFPIVENGGTVENANGPTNYSVGYRQAISAGVRYTTTDLQAVMDGTSGTNQTAVGGSIYDFSAEPLSIGAGDPTAAFNGTIASVEMWDSDIGASELETETA